MIPYTFAFTNNPVKQNDNMKEETSNTEQSILKAAEKEFLKKGFSGSKTTEIAKELV